MDLHAYTKTLFDLFSINKKYVVPRFQRDYSWGDDELTEVWRDLTASIITKQGRLENQEYFIGSLVLVGEDKSTEFKIVDGQQRLTTITLLMSALVDQFSELGKEDMTKGLYGFIEGRDVSNKQFFKLENENPKPFLQNAIQNYTKTRMQPTSACGKHVLSALPASEMPLSPHLANSLFNCMVLSVIFARSSW